jgi:hypothetical protein
MKLLESPKLEALNHLLSIRAGDCIIDGRIESYSCKMTGDDKRLFRCLSTEHGMTPTDLQALSPPNQSSLSHSPCTAYGGRSPGEEDGGVLCDTISTKTLFYLISTLNESFNPDYDFSNARSGEFSREPSLQWVMNGVECQLLTAVGARFNSLKEQLWKTIDDAITLQDCVIYSYNPELTSDPYGEEGCIWSFNYFFYNRKLKRIVFFTCRASSVVDRQSEEFDEFGFRSEFSRGNSVGDDSGMDCVYPDDDMDEDVSVAVC